MAKGPLRASGTHFWVLIHVESVWARLDIVESMASALVVRMGLLDSFGAEILDMVENGVI